MAFAINWMQVLLVVRSPLPVYFGHVPGAIFHMETINECRSRCCVPPIWTYAGGREHAGTCRLLITVSPLAELLLQRRYG